MLVRLGIAALFLAALSADGLSQGYITFYNRLIIDPDINNGLPRNVPSGIYYAGNFGGFLGPDYSIGLFRKNASGSYTLVLNPDGTGVVPFRNNPTTGLPDGYMSSQMTVAVPGVPAGSPLTFQLRAWRTGDDPYFGIRGESANLTVSQLGGITPQNTVVPTPNLNGLGFTGVNVSILSPEPTTYALLSATVVLICCFRKKRSENPVPR